MKRELPPFREPAGDAAGWAWPLALAERVLLPARPVVTAVMPPVSHRPYPVDLLCGHRYRACEMALLVAGATVHDETDIVLPAGEEPMLSPPAAWTR